MRPTPSFRSALLLAALAVLALVSTPASAQPPAISEESAVQLQPVEALALPDRHVASASVLAPNDAVIAAEVAATVAAVHAEAGRSVERGALLISLDERDAQLALAQASAQLQAATARLTLATHRAERGRNLRADKHISEDALMALETGLDGARADVALARAGRGVAARQLGKCQVRAPFDGVVLERQAQVGALAAPGTPLLRLVSLQAAEVEAQIAPESATDLREAREILFESQGQRYPVRLSALSPVLERSARTQLARLEFTAAAAPAGSTGQLSWIGPRLLFPAALMIKRNGRLGAFIDEAGVARFAHAADAQEGRPFRLQLAPGTRMVSRGQQGLNDGDALPVVEQ